MPQGSILYACQSGRYVLKCVGEVRLTLCSTLEQHIDHILRSGLVCDIVIDLTETESIDSTSLGLIAKLAVCAKSLGLEPPALVSTNPDITAILKIMGFDQVFILLDELPASPQDFRKLPFVQECEDKMRERIIAAHKVLISLNEANRDAFIDLVRTLEGQEK